MAPPRTSGGMKRILVAALSAVAVVSTGGVATAETPDDVSYSSLSVAVAALADDDPAPTDWTTHAPDNDSASHLDAFAASGGRTGWFGQSWYDLDGNGCDTRDDILKRDLGDIVYRDRSACVVAAGILEDPYTGATIRFKRGKETSQDVQIDHVIPLGFVYAHGGWRWGADTRLAVANDPLNLLAVDGHANSSKSDAGPATSPKGTGADYVVNGGGGWLPDNSDYTCRYAARFARVALKYELGLGKADSVALSKILTQCATTEDALQPSPSDEAAPASGVADLFALPQPIRRLRERVEGWLTEHPIYVVGAALGLYLMATRTTRGRR